MAVMSGVEMPLSAVRAQVASAVEMIVQIARFPDGSRRLTELAEVMGLDSRGDYQVNPLFAFELKGRDEKTGQVTGHIKPLGNKPSFLKELGLTGINLDLKLFG